MMKRILLIGLGIIVLFFIIGFFLPDRMEISKSISVNAPAAYSFEEINDLERWQGWSYWNTLDTAMIVIYADKRSGEGSAYSWKSEEMGEGKLTIIESVPYKSIKADLDFMENGTAKSWYTFEPAGDSTKVTMGFAAEYGMNPLMRWFGVTFMKGEMNKAFDYNLAHIKQIAEAKPKFNVKISEEDVPVLNYIGLSHTMSPKDHLAIGKQMEKMYTELYGALAKSKVEIKGYPFCLYPSYDETSMDMICALPVSADAKIPSNYKIERAGGVKAVKAIHNGAYSNLEATYNDINKYIAYKKLSINGAPWEVYVTDPTTERDTSKWITEVYYPVAVSIP